MGRTDVELSSAEDEPKPMLENSAGVDEEPRLKMLLDEGGAGGDGPLAGAEESVVIGVDEVL